MAQEIPVLVPQMVDVNVTLTCVALFTQLGRTVNVRSNLMENVFQKLPVFVQKDFHAKIILQALFVMLVCLLGGSNVHSLTVMWQRLSLFSNKGLSIVNNPPELLLGLKVAA